MRDNKHEDSFILMVVYNAIQYDARVIRAAEAIKNIGENVCVISCNSDESYLNKNFKSISFNSKLKGALLLFSFWCYVVRYSVNNRKNIKLIYVHDYYLCGIGNLLSKIIKVKWVYDAHELLIERKGTKYNCRETFFLLLEKFSIRHADLVVAANEERERIIKYVYKLKNTIFVLNISPNTILINNDHVSEKEDYIVYQGYLSKDRDLGDYISLLKNLPKNIKLKIIGGGPDLKYFKDLVTKLDLNDRVVFTGKVPYSQLVNENKDCKIGIVSYSLNGLNNYYCSPNKLYEYAQLNIPMIFSSQPFLVNIANKYRIGEVIPKKMSDADKADIIMKLFDNINYYRENISCFLSDYTYEHEMNKLKESIKNLISESTLKCSKSKNLTL
jgi:glycosyltransferase involved in cell wall biosynthesis